MDFLSYIVLNMHFSTSSTTLWYRKYPSVSLSWVNGWSCIMKMSSLDYFWASLWTTSLFFHILLSEPQCCANCKNCTPGHFWNISNLSHSSSIHFFAPQSISITGKSLCLDCPRITFVTFLIQQKVFLYYDVKLEIKTRNTFNLLGEEGNKMKNKNTSLLNFE